MQKSGSSCLHLNCLTHTFGTLCTRHLQSKRKAYFTRGFVQEDRRGPSDTSPPPPHLDLVGMFVSRFRFSFFLGRITL